MPRIDQPTTPFVASRDPRKTEDTDTRQALQRHDPEFHKKKKDEKEEGGFKDPYEDLTDVSVAALRNFLLGLLDRLPQAEDTQNTVAAPQQETRPAANPKAAAAINAYQTGASRGASGPAPAPIQQPKSQTSALDTAASNLDRATLLELIRDLDRLAAEGVNAISLEKGAGGFLENIRMAVTRARG
ncbi:MAG: hypothetical protein EBQ96_07115 [Proteobacteria bacterium]|nr:hypothetical protein [Pseudomonadota bacterium]